MSKYKCSCGEDRPEYMMNRGGGRKAYNLCKACHNRNTIERARENKKLYVEYKGGKCSKCGYNKCMAALDFHHRDPACKDPSFKSIKFWEFDRAKQELDKCDLVCRNCHSEIHYHQELLGI